tara:strand:+ start:904 stop:1227 length:324 start_codon:yes stop_codon:yes gene_type:complete
MHVRSSNSSSFVVFIDEVLSSQLFFKDAAWRRRIDDFILLDDNDDDGNERVVGLVGWLEHEHDACEEEDNVRWQSIGAIVAPKLLPRDVKKKFLGISFFVNPEKRKN